jgi:hypothetical protein
MASGKSDPDRLLRVFLCHSTEDKPAVRDLCERLQSDNFDPCLDEIALMAGQDWAHEIRVVSLFGRGDERRIRAKGDKAGSGYSRRETRRSGFYHPTQVG